MSEQKQLDRAREVMVEIGDIEAATTCNMVI